jgi:hypothetical protein
LLVEEGERAALNFQRKDFEIVRKIKFAPKPNKPDSADTGSQWSFSCEKIWSLIYF